MSAIPTIAVIKDGDRVVINLEDLEARKAQGWKVEGEAESPAPTTARKSKKTE